MKTGIQLQQRHLCAMWGHPLLGIRVPQGKDSIKYHNDRRAPVWDCVSLAPAHLALRLTVSEHCSCSIIICNFCCTKFSKGLWPFVVWVLILFSCCWYGKWKRIGVSIHRWREKSPGNQAALVLELMEAVSCPAERKYIEKTASRG